MYPSMWEMLIGETKMQYFSLNGTDVVLGVLVVVLCVLSSIPKVLTLYSIIRGEGDNNSVNVECDSTTSSSLRLAVQIVRTSTANPDVMSSHI